MTTTNLGFAGLALAALSAICCLFLACIVLVVELREWVDNRRNRRDWTSQDQRALAEDAEVAALDELWELPSVAGSLPMRPARHGRVSSNRLHRGF